MRAYHQRIEVTHSKELLFGRPDRLSALTKRAIEALVIAVTHFRLRRLILALMNSSN